MDDEHILALVKTIDRADFHAVGVFAGNAVVDHHIGHGGIPSLNRSKVCLNEVQASFK
jgi:hypothetical protein